MYVDLHCGACESQMTLDAEDNSPGVWMLVHRFANAHAACNYVTPPSEPTSEPVRTVTPTPRKRVIKRVRDADE